MNDDIRDGRILISEGFHLIYRDLDDEGLPCDEVTVHGLDGAMKVRRMSAALLQQAVDEGTMSVIDRDELMDAVSDCIGSDEEGLPRIMTPYRSGAPSAKPVPERLLTHMGIVTGKGRQRWPGGGNVRG